MISTSLRLGFAAALASSALVACGDDGATPDAAPVYNYDFTCAGNTLPATAPATVNVGGFTQSVYIDQGFVTLSMLPDADLVACKADMPVCDETTNYGTAKAGADGAFLFTPPPETGGVPLDVYAYVKKTGSRTTYLWPNSPFYADNPTVKVPVMLNAFVAQLSALGIQQSPERGIVGVLLVDCNDEPIVDADNVKITLSQDGADIGSLTFIDAHIFNADFAGDFFILNVPVGKIDISVTYKGMEMRGHSVLTFAGATSETKIAPGFRPTS